MITPGGTSWDWDNFDLDAWLKHLGQQLEAKQAAGESVEWDTIYDVAVSTVGSDADSLVDETSDALFDRQRIIVWYRFIGHFDSYAAISVADLGSEKLFVCELPHDEMGTWWILRGIVDRDDTKGIVNAANSLLENEWIPNKIEIEPPLTRKHVEKAFRASLTLDLEWNNLADIMSQDGHDLPFATEAEREKLLEVYLKQALDE